MSWSISLNVYGFCNFGAKIWFNLSLAIIPVLAFIHIEQFFKAYSRQQNQKHPRPPTPPLGDISAQRFLKARPLIWLQSREEAQTALLFLHRELCGMCSQAAHGAFSSVICVWAERAARAPRAFRERWVCRTFCSDLSEQSSPHTNRCDIALGRERGCWFCWFFFFWLVLFFLPRDVGLLYMKPEARVFVTSVVRAVKSKWIFCIAVLVLKYRLG